MAKFSSSASGLSATLAIAMGILLPFLETIRRWSQMSQIPYFTYWFDDYLIGGFLLYAAWTILKGHHRGLLVLSASWGAATGMMILSFLGQLISLNQPDPAPFPVVVVVLIKGLLLAGALTGLILTLRSPMPAGGDQVILKSGG